LGTLVALALRFAAASRSASAISSSVGHVCSPASVSTSFSTISASCASVGLASVGLAALASVSMPFAFSRSRNCTGSAGPSILEI
jgi:hypothetical protein